MMMILSRLKEPSTFAGLAGVLAGIGVLGLSEATWGSVFAAVAVVAGAVAAVVKERGGDSSSSD